MKEHTFCDDFQGLLDRFAAGSLTPAEIDLLHSHAEECESCGLLMEIHANLAVPSTGTLSEQIPDTMIAQVWDRVAESLPHEEQFHAERSRGWLRLPWLVPAFAVTTIVFIFLNIFLFAELGRLRRREHNLTRLLTQQTRVLEEIRDRRMDASVARRTEDTFNKNRLRLLAGQKSMSVAELRSFLEQVPHDLQILTGSYVEHILAQMPSWEKKKWERVLAAIDLTDGIQTGEAITILDALPLDPDDTITPAHLVSLAEL